MSNHENQVNTEDPTLNLEGVTAGTEGQTSVLPPNGGDRLNSAINTDSIINAPVEGATQEEIDLIKTRASQLGGSGIPDLTQSDLFPGMQSAQQAGSVSGKVIGSQPIFGTGPNVFPVAANLARKKALADAAAAKAKATAEIKLPERPKFDKALRFNRGLDKDIDAFNEDFFGRATKAVGAENAKMMLTSDETKIGRDYQKGLRAYETLVSEGDNIAEMFAQMDEHIEAGGVTFSDEALNARDKFNDIQSDLMDKDGVPDPDKLVELVNAYKDTKGLVALSTVINEAKLNAIKGELVQVAGVSDFDEYLQVSKNKTQDFDRDVEILINTMTAPGGELRPHIVDGNITSDQIKDYLKAQLGTSKERDVSVQFKPSSAGGSLREEDLSGTEGARDDFQFKQYDDNGNETGSFTTSSKKGDEFPSAGKPMKLSGVKQVVDSDGKTVMIPGTVDIKLIRTALMDVAVFNDKGVKTSTGQKPVVIAEWTDEVQVQVPVIGKNGRETGEFTTEIQKIRKEGPVEYDAAMDAAIMTNRKGLKVTEGAAKKLRSNVMLGKEDVPLTAEELIEKYKN